jgi:diguanylate cyclase (GGDEF)-like protein
MGKLSRKLTGWVLDADPHSTSGRALIEERYRSLRRQVPIVYLLGFVNLSGMELATVGRLSAGLNLPTFIAVCGLVRMWSWFARRKPVTEELMVRRMVQTVVFAAAVCLAVCWRCIELLNNSDSTSHMAVMLFGGLTAIGVSYGLTALPAAGRIPLLLIIFPLAAMTLVSDDPQFQWAAFSLVVVAALTMRLLAVHNRHMADVIRSRSLIARQIELAEDAHHEAVVAATTDFLTNLPNRRAFVAALEEEIARDGCWGSFALAILDLDRFKAVNDTFGHGAGDALLKEVAERLLRAVGDRGTVARLGGDEFAVLLPGVEHAAEATFVGAHILREVNRPMAFGRRKFGISACCGFAIAERGGQSSPSRVMADADLALYEAKDAAAGGVCVFEARLEAPRRRRQEIERALQVPGVEEEFRLNFQAIVDLGSGEVIAHEALARWTTKALGSVSPAEFVPIAEQLNLIDDINNRLMAKAFEEAARWPYGIKLSFNLSAVQLCAAGSAEALLEVLAETGLAATRLQAEVTETALLADFDTARVNLTRLREAGVTIVLDDFGAGFASIGYLRELRFDQIKLDGALVTAARHSADGKRLLSAVIALCDILGVMTVAEHVESEDLLCLLKELGCSAGQGFWLHKPVPADCLAALHGGSAPCILALASRRGRHAA